MFVSTFLGLQPARPGFVSYIVSRKSPRDLDDRSPGPLKFTVFAASEDRSEQKKKIFRRFAKDGEKIRRFLQHFMSDTSNSEPVYKIAAVRKEAAEASQPGSSASGRPMRPILPAEAIIETLFGGLLRPTDRVSWNSTLFWYLPLPGTELVLPAGIWLVLLVSLAILAPNFASGLLCTFVTFAAISRSLSGRRLPVPLPPIFYPLFSVALAFLSFLKFIFFPFWFAYIPFWYVLFIANPVLVVFLSLLARYVSYPQFASPAIIFGALSTFLVFESVPFWASMLFASAMFSWLARPRRRISSKYN